MRGTRVLGLALCGGLLVCGYAGSQDTPVGTPKEQIQHLRQRQREHQKSLNVIIRKLELNKNEEIIQLKKAIQAAQQAYNNAIKAKASADPEGAQLIIQIDEIDAKIKGLLKKPKRVRKRRKAPVK